MKILDLQNVSFSYEKNDFIRDLSLSLNGGEFVSLIGANGSGKSTILKLSAGILKPCAGEINLWGKPIHLYGGKDRAKLISYLPQILDINIPFKVKELVSMGLYPYDVPPALSAEEAMKMVGLDEGGNSFVTKLSGGEKRRVFIAMTLLQGAGILLLDEPIANLDIKYQVELIRLLKKLKNDKNISIVMALHDMNMVFQFDYTYVLKEGKLVASGPPHDIITDKLIKNVFDVDITINKIGEKGYWCYEA